MQNSSLGRLWSLAASKAQRIAFLPPLVLRVVLGVTFAFTGWGKLNNPAWMVTGEAGQKDMVGDTHKIADRPVVAQPAGRVGEDQRVTAQRP